MIKIKASTKNKKDIEIINVKGKINKGSVNELIAILDKVLYCLDEQANIKIAEALVLRNKLRKEEIK